MDNNEKQDEPILSREEYRKQKQAAQESKGSQRLKQVTNIDFLTAKKDQPELTPESRSKRLKWRLNMAIVVLLGLIILTYLILFFVG